MTDLSDREVDLPERQKLVCQRDTWSSDLFDRGRHVNGEGDLSDRQETCMTDLSDRGKLV